MKPPARLEESSKDCDNKGCILRDVAAFWLLDCTSQWHIAGPQICGSEKDAISLLPFAYLA